jgi:hypothetical protein
MEHFSSIYVSNSSSFPILVGRKLGFLSIYGHSHLSQIFIHIDLVVNFGKNQQEDYPMRLPIVESSRKSDPHKICYFDIPSLSMSNNFFT